MNDCPPWFVEASFRYSEPLRQWLRSVPGCDWDKEKRVWRVPIEMREMFEKECEKNGIRPVYTNH